MRRLRTAILAMNFVTMASANNVYHIQPRIDRRFELMSIVFRLAGFKEYRLGNIVDYNATVDRYFTPVKNHEAVKIASELRNTVGFDAIPNLAVRTKDAVTFAPLHPLDDPNAGLDERWKPEVAGRFLKALAAFAKDADAEGFFRAQDPFYRKILEGSRRDLVARLDLEWFKRTFGEQSRDTFILCIAPLNGGTNYGPSCPNAQGGNDLFAFIGTPPAGRGEIPVVGQESFPTLVHEFLHSFANPWVERNLRAVLAAGEALNAPVIQWMRDQGYGQPETALKESLVRAWTIRYFRETHQDPKADVEEKENESCGFYWVKDLAEALGAVTSERRQDGGMDAFTPKLVMAFNRLGAEAPARAATWKEARRAQMEALFESGPKLVSVDPANGSQDVAPETSVIRFTFDRPMSDGVALMRAGGDFPESAGKPTWDQEGKVLTLPVTLSPGKDYRLALNAENFYVFKDRQGRPLRPVVLTFRTREQRK